MKSPITYIWMVGIALFSVGCSATKGEIAKQLDEVKQEMTSLRASNSALKDRVDALEMTPATTTTDSGDVVAEKSDRPKLEVVHLTPTDEMGDLSPILPVITAPADDRPAVDIVGDKDGVEQVEPAAAAAPSAAGPAGRQGAGKAKTAAGRAKK